MNERWRLKRSRTGTLKLGEKCYLLYFKGPKCTWASVGSRMGISGSHARRVAKRYANMSSHPWRNENEVELTQR